MADIEPTENPTPPQSNTSVSALFGAFTHQSTGGDDEILRIASQYALQIRPDQIDCISRLRTFAIDYAKENSDLEAKIERFIKSYLEIKHYHESSMFIGRIIDSLSVKRLFPTDAGKINVQK